MNNEQCSDCRNQTESTYLTSLETALGVFRSLRGMQTDLEQAADLCCRALRGGNKLLVCGNGGSAAEAQHLVGELMGRYMLDRVPLPAVALMVDSALVTCIGNDYSFDDVFARQVRGLGEAGDVLVTFSTSGNSPNILEALSVAREKGIESIAFLGRDGGTARGLCGHALVVPHANTARIQEAHQFLMHSLMDRIELGLA
ncbi:MAG: SIS domain-containing protein [Acidobacteriaceae bacterium]|nr:SIS domain-containing protein [Acidobacteriaceae bacterium]